MTRTDATDAAESAGLLDMLRDSAADFCAREAPLVRLRALKQAPVDYDAACWGAMVGLGWSAVLIPEAHGGLGLDVAAAAVVAEELGKVAAPEPVLECAGFAAPLLVAFDDEAPVQELLARIANGDAVITVAAGEYHHGDVHALPEARGGDAGFVLSGRVDCVPLARAADGFLVPARLDHRHALFYVPRDQEGLSVGPRVLADNTSHAELTFDAAVLVADRLLGHGPRVAAAMNYALDVTHVLTSAYLVGLMSSALDTTLDYLRTRRQFGRAIGSFQALQHRAVDLFIQQQLSRAVVGDAVARIGTCADERTVFASRARYRATEAALAITRQAIQLHGAIGFTYECDIGHFLNRAMVLAARNGNANSHLRRLGARLRASRTETTDAGPESPAVTFSGDYNALSDAAFRSLVRGWFEANYPAALRYPPRRLHWNEIRPWYLQLSARGWAAPNWPVTYGGMGLSPSKMLIFIEEQERWGVARTPDMGITMVGPLLIRHGTEAQRERYLPPILAGEHIWCQGYSEPNAGSDLASLQCEACLDGDEFVVNGQKTWTTLAQDATHCFLLVRTDKNVRQQAGISFLLVDIASPGITIRPIRNLAGDEEFCEVFFDDVRVPAENLVGELNAGWSIAKALLSFERIFLGSPKQSQYALQRLETIARARHLFDDDGFADRFTRLRLDTLDLEAVYARYAQIVRDGGTLGPDVSLLKIWATETFARLSELMLEAAGDRGAERGDLPFGDGSANILGQFYNARPATIYGGSNEIQRNIIAKNVLDLPGG